MNSTLVTKAFNLFVETLPLEAMELNDQTSFVWHDLYSKECQLFECLRQMTPEENTEYIRKIKLASTN